MAKKSFDTAVEADDDLMVNPLRNETVIVRHIEKKSDMFDSKKHVFWGGIADTSKKIFVVPILRNGTYVNVLTNSEKAYLEKVMGLGENALSVYNKTNNYWSSANPAAVVELGKYDLLLNLAEPADYIKYKILLANKDRICPDVETLENHFKASYEFVLIKSEEEMDDKKKKMSTLMECYKLYGKIEEETDKLRCIIELINQKPLATGTKLSWLQTTCNDLIQGQPKLFLKVISDPLLDTKVFIKRCIAEGLISNRGGMMYLRKDNQPLCEGGEEPTLQVAARWLNQPQHREVKLTLEGTINGRKD